KMGMAAFVVPFMFFSSPELLMQGEWINIIHVVAGALLGVFLLSSAVQGWYFGHLHMVLRIVLAVAAVAMIDSGWLTDFVGIGTAVVVWAIQKRIVKPDALARGSD
ncbi:MAG: TRAP transporter permease, partial [Paracoccaceae bacterium]